MQMFGSFRWCHYHLRKYWFLFLQIGELFLKIAILLLLLNHSQLKRSIQRFNKRSSCLNDFLIDIFDLRLHALQFLAIQFNKFMILLQIFICLSCEILNGGQYTSTIPWWPRACVELWESFSGESKWLICSYFIYITSKCKNQLMTNNDVKTNKSYLLDIEACYFTNCCFHHSNKLNYFRFFGFFAISKEIFAETLNIPFDLPLYRPLIVLYVLFILLKLVLFPFQYLHLLLVSTHHLILSLFTFFNFVLRFF